jgi:hypothetical protein
MDLKAVGREDVDWIHVAQDRVYWRTRVNEPSGSTEVGLFAEFMSETRKGGCSATDDDDDE